MKSIISGFCSYAALEIITLIIIAIMALFDSDIMNIINTTESVNLLTIKSILRVVLACYLGGAIVFYCIGNKKLQKGVNVE